MATRRSRVPPPRPGQPVPKEYVREQLDILGIRNVSEQEIESYAAGKAGLSSVSVCVIDIMCIPSVCVVCTCVHAVVTHLYVPYHVPKTLRRKL